MSTPSPSSTFLPSSPPLSNARLVLHVTITVSPSNIEGFLRALRPCWTAVVAEPECLFFDVSMDASRPGRFRFVEAWTRDRKWFEEVQLPKDYYGPYVEITRSMWEGERKLEYFERVPGWSAVKDKGFLEGDLIKS